MKVYLLQEDWGYDGIYVIGVFASKELALSSQKTHEKLHPYIKGKLEIREMELNKLEEQ